MWGWYFDCALLASCTTLLILPTDTALKLLLQETTENDWGTWNEFTARDKAAMKRIFTMLRFFGKRGLLTSPDWVPHVAGCVQPGVYASLFPHGGERLFTLVNRGNNDTSGAQLRLTKSSLSATSVVYDCWRGEKLEPSAEGTLSFPMEVEGFGCVLITSEAKASAELSSYLKSMRTFTAEGPLNSFSKDFHFLQQKMLPHPRTPRAVVAQAGAPAGMMAIPAAARGFDYDVTAKIDQGADSQLYWENPQVTSKNPNLPAANAWKVHSMRLPIEGFLMDKHPVTTAEYGAYLTSSQYSPVDSYNFLLNWNGSRSPPPSIAKKPVTYVGYKEAEAFCKASGKRLPHDWEFQYAGQGLDGRKWPWGSHNCSTCAPKQVTATQIPEAPDVGSCSPQGDSPFGVSDMVGTVWQYTTSFVDAHDRNCLTRGSSNYQPGIRGVKGSHWYYPDAPQLNQHEKMKMMSNSYERAGTLGFRCVKDVKDLTLKNPCTDRKICGRWSGPPYAFTSLSAGSAQEWVRWHVKNHTLHTTKSTQGAGSMIGPLKPLCAGLAADRTAGVSFIGINGVNATLAVGSSCGFSLDVTIDGKGPQTLALFGSATKPLTVTAMAHDGQETSIVKSLILTTNQSTTGTVVDTHVHVTLDGAAGDVVTLKWLAANSEPPPPPPPPQHAYNYTELKQTRCTVLQHGATATLGNSTEKTVAQCKRRCDDDDTCSCAVFTPESGQCERMAQCIAPNCLGGDSRHNTYVKAYTLLDGLNCYHGHGAGTDIDAEPVPDLTQAQCADRCEADNSCTGAVHSVKGEKKGDCWKRSNIVVSQCAHIAFQSMLLKPTVAMAAASFSAVALHGATLTRGGAPELPGYEAMPS